MSQIHIRHIRNEIDTTFGDLVDISDWASAPENQRRKAFLARALAAYVVEQIGEVAAPRAAASVTDGGQDNGIDAIDVDADNRQVLVVQSKWDEDGASSPAVGDVQKFLQGFRDLIDGRFDRFNDRVRSRADELTAALDDPNVTFLLVLAHTGQHELSTDARRLFEDLMDEVNDASDVAAYRILGQGDLHALVRRRVEGEAIDLEVVLHEWGTTPEPFTAFYGQVDAAEVATWWADHGNRLFAKNLRKLIPNSQVNDAITRTLMQDPEKFWYFNNGITALCERVAKTPRGSGDRRWGQFSCEGVSIVNGAQTVGCIGEVGAKDPEVVKGSRVNVRFISLQDCPPDFAAEVTRATNTQNRIERRDFAALDPEQERLRTELKLENDKTYAIKTGEPDPPPNQGCSIQEATVALACAHPDPFLAVQAKREVGRLWDNISKSPYTQLFNSSLSGMQMWRTVEVLRRVESTLRNEQSRRWGRARGVAVHGNRLIAHLVFRQLPGNALRDPVRDWDEILHGLDDKTVETLDRLTALVEKEYEGNYLASLFKNLTKCKRLVGLARIDT